MAQKALSEQQQNLLKKILEENKFSSIREAARIIQSKDFSHHKEFLHLHEGSLGRWIKRIKETEHNKQETVIHDDSVEEKFDQRSKGEPLRDNLGKIIGYKYLIFIRDMPSLEGTFTREEMDLVYRLYSSNDGANLNQRSVSREFPNITFRDFKRILRAFNITKDSIPVAPHVLEEIDPDKVASVIRQNKENIVFKKLEQDRSKYYEVLLRSCQRELLEIKLQKKLSEDLLKVLIEESSTNLSPFILPQISLSGEKKTLLVYISDQHVGAHISDKSLFDIEYNPSVFSNRMEQTLIEIGVQFSRFGRFQEIIIINLGDNVDGYEGQTTRGGHDLLQNLDSRGQAKIYTKAMRDFIDSVHSLDITNEISMYCVGNDNHSGAFGWVINYALQVYCEVRYPEMKFKLYERFIDHFIIHNHTFIVSHGKDEKNRKFGLPLIINEPTESLINQYIDHNRISGEISFISGDLHQSATTYGKRFRYKKIPSMFGSSDWILENFGLTAPGYELELMIGQDLYSCKKDLK